MEPATSSVCIPAELTTIEGPFDNLQLRKFGEGDDREWYLPIDDSGDIQSSTGHPSPRAELEFKIARPKRKFPQVYVHLVHTYGWKMANKGTRGFCSQLMYDASLMLYRKGLKKAVWCVLDNCR